MIHRSPLGELHYPDLTVDRLLLDAMARRPADEVALIDAAADRRLTVGEIAERTRRVAAGLQARGLEPGQVVALVCPNVLEYAEILLGVWLAGGTVTTINPLVTADDLAAMASETEARFVFTVSALLPTVADGARRGGGGAAEVFVIGPGNGATPYDRLLESDPAAYRPPVRPSADPPLAALPWSSGTSGKPKAVMLTHGNLVSQLHQFLETQCHKPGDPIIAVLPFFHIYGLVLILIAALWHGMPLVVLPRFELEAFLGALARYRVVLAPLVPPIVIALAKHPIVAKFDLSALRYVMSGAAPLGGDVQELCAARLGCHVFQGYGMTELSGASHLHNLEKGSGRAGTVGKLVAGMEARIVDPDTGADLGVGARGELWLRGPNVMQGYLNRPEATAATLDPDGWLHTGDIAVVDADGLYSIVDRVKELIKYKGHQVAPADLEAVLLTHPDVVDAAVIPSPCDEAGEVPKAFVVARGPLTETAVIEFVAGRVAPQDKIRRVEFVEAIPKSPSGKILRRVLVERERAAAR